jgi:hypothetical protein
VTPSGRAAEAKKGARRLMKRWGIAPKHSPIGNQALQQ